VTTNGLLRTGGFTLPGEAWARANMDKLQQNYLMSHPVLAEGDIVCVDLLSGYFREQFKVNTHDDPQT
jgi:beta-D-galactosyl-(1->4)-L-rhamnose phosphorylase